ncbi:MAG: hypothetical protein AAF429_12510 [Pseudomonadota bacterium]
MVTPYDEKDLSAEDTVIRRISEHHIVEDSNGKKRVSTAVFAMSSNSGISIDIPKLMIADSVDPYDFVTTPIFFASVELNVGDIRNEGFLIGYEPIFDDPELEDNPYHGEIWRDSKDRPFHITGGEKKSLLRKSNWFVTAENVYLNESQQRHKN